MSIARHHAEWLSLLEISGPFLSMPVLMRAFPQGLDAHDSELAQTLRIVYEEWLDNQRGLQPDPAIHRAWIEWVLRNVLEMPAEVIISSDLNGHKADQSSKDGLSDFAITVAEYAETIHPDLAIVGPTSVGEHDSHSAARLLMQILPPGQDLEKPLAQHYWLASPATRMMTLLHATGTRLGLVTNGERWMLVDAPKGETTGFTSWYAELWLDEPLTLRAFRSLLSVRRFFGVADKESIEALLAASASDQQEVTDQLGYQVRRAVEMLVQAIDLADQDREHSLL
ncbi:MAG: restriction endonuclease, partial [Chloroflexi bacterium]|nr:restriction endonuclease [Chloroflexota bacterium]